MNKLGTGKRAAIVRALVEGNSVRATSRLCDVSKVTVLRLLADVGQLCHDFHDLTVRGLKSKRVQVDEVVWSFVGCKQRSREKGKQGHGDAWVWLAMDADSKLVVSYLIGNRDAYAASEFMWDVADRLAERVQLTSDGHGSYLHAVPSAFGDNIDYAMLVKIYGNPPVSDAATRYSPGICVGAERRAIIGNPAREHVSTSYIERQNLSLRMGNRRFTRLTNGFSKSLTNHGHAIALYYWHYNFARKHQTLGTTPAVAAGIAERAMTVDDLVTLLMDEERIRAKGGRLNRADKK